MTSSSSTGTTTFLKNLSIGAASGCIAACTIFPLDLLKTKIQSSSGQQSIVQIIRDTIRPDNGGLGALYRGLAPNLVGIMPEKAIKLAANDFFRSFYSSKFVGNSSKQQGQIQQLPLWIEVLSGGSAGACQVVATTPMELLKINAQMAGKNHSTIAFIKQVGLAGMYKGLTATLMRDVPFSMIYFSLYARIKNYYRAQAQQEYLPLPKVLLSSIIAGTFAAALATPMDVIKTRLQYAGSSGTQGMTYIQAAKYCYANKLLWKGTLPRVLIISPLFGITLLCYEGFQKLLGITTV
ncbi:hypothetical protein FDP41_007052 [Naegleria fowleri]|uniref:Mitochondrial carrier protein n=1 Tax=Naegleria fowleri TaxID=5763 RepID=A0A6A5BIX3_NAEFO|nr:uncharacterized protein FDP41_007052 [Naegleria fowleri]KAF0973665.1 hypothetical protein FDP41_007052 [Naegleria fowleri]